MVCHGGPWWDLRLQIVSGPVADGTIFVDLGSAVRDRPGGRRGLLPGERVALRRLWIGKRLYHPVPKSSFNFDPSLDLIFLWSDRQCRAFSKL